MPRYAITERAGRFVAGHTNTGVGTVLTLSEKQAEHEIRLGTLVSLDMPTPEATQGASVARKPSSRANARKVAVATAGAPAADDAAE